MKTTFIFAYLLGLAFFLLQKRRFDVFSIAYFSCGIYFLPGFTGFAILPNASGDIADWVPIVDETYLVFIVVCMSIVASAIIYGLTAKESRFNLPPERGRFVCLTLFLLSIAGVSYEFSRTGTAVFFEDKVSFINDLTRGLVLFESAAALLAVCAFIYRERLFLFLALLLMAFDMYIGFRVALATTGVAIVLLAFTQKGQFRLLFIKQQQLAAILIFGMLLFIYKGVYTSIKFGAWETVTKALSDPQYYLASVVGSEPFVTQLILNETVATGFKMQAPSLLDYALQIVPFSPETGLYYYFNPAFSSELLFPGFKFGLGNNIWAEVYSYGGWPFLIAFLFVFNGVCAVGSSMLVKCRSRLGAASTALFFSVWAFYIHRNTIDYQITLQKRVIMVFVAAFIAQALMKVIKPDKKKTQAGQETTVIGSGPARSRLSGKSSAHVLRVAYNSSRND